jgi:hypothetical protein
MLTITLQRAEQVRQYSIHPRSSDGWIVTRMEDQKLTRHVCYRDWHRVERTVAMVHLEVARLVAHGWEVRSSNF